jgi:hypothetical protein
MKPLFRNKIMSIRHPLLLSSILFISLVHSQESNFNKPFSNRIIFSQTPEIGEKWHGGIRTNDLLAWEAYWNCADIFSLDFFRAGVKELTFRGENGDTITLTDYLTQISIKSRPLYATIWNNPYAIAAGITLQSSAFNFQNQFGEGIFSDPSGELSLFAAQSWFFNRRHYFNLATIATFIKTEGMEKPVTTIYLIPGYRYFIDKKQSWSFDIEHYFMNPIELPYKTLQYMFDSENNEFYNPEQRFVSFTFWGFSYSRKHLRIELHLGHHISFIGPIIPMAGIGWDF